MKKLQKLRLDSNIKWKSLNNSYLNIIELLLRVIHLTESRWLNEYDQNRWDELASSKWHFLSRFDKKIEFTFGDKREVTCRTIVPYLWLKKRVCKREKRGRKDKRKKMKGWIHTVVKLLYYLHNWTDKNKTHKISGGCFSSQH